MPPTTVPRTTRAQGSVALRLRVTKALVRQAKLKTLMSQVTLMDRVTPKTTIELSRGLVAPAGEECHRADDRSKGLPGSRVSGEFSIEDKRELEGLLEEFPKCQDELDGIWQTHTLLLQLAANEPPKELKDKVLAQVAEAGVRCPGLFSHTKATWRPATSRSQR